MTTLPTDAEPSTRPAWSRAADELLRRFRAPGMAGEMARGATWAFGITALGTLVSLGVQVLLARTIGAYDYGVYALTLAAMNIVLVFAKLDLDGASVRFVGEYKALQRWGLLRGFLHRSRQVVLVASISIGAFAAALVWILGRDLPSGTRLAYLIGCALLPVSALLQLHSMALRGFKQVIRSQAPSLLLRPVLLGSGILTVVYVFGLSIGAAGAVALNVGAAGVALLVSVRLLAGIMPPELHQAPPQYAAAEWRRVAIGLILISLSQLILSQQADVVIVGTLIGATSAGHYGAASQLAMLVQFGASAIFFLATPAMAELHAHGRRGDLQRLITLVDRATLALSVPILVVLIAGGRFLLGLYSPSFVGAYSVLIILGISQSVIAVVGAGAGFLLSMTGRQHLAAWIIGASAILNIVLTFALTPIFGMVGTASATAVSTFARSVALVVVIRRRLGINATPFARLRQPVADPAEGAVNRG